MTLTHCIEIAKDRFVGFRGGNAFIGVLLLALISYELAHQFLGLDPDRAVANFWLSVEASLATCLLLDFSVKNMAADRQKLGQIVEFEERIIALEQTIIDKITP